MKLCQKTALRLLTILLVYLGTGIAATIAQDAVPADGKAVQQSQKKIASYERNIERLKVEISTLSEQIPMQRQKAEQGASAIAPKREAYLKKKDAYESLKKSSDSAGELKNARFKFFLVEKKFKRQESDSTKANDKLSTMEKQLDIKKGALAKNTKNAKTRRAQLIQERGALAKQEALTKQQQTKKAERQALAKRSSERKSQQLALETQEQARLEEDKKARQLALEKQQEERKAQAQREAAANSEVASATDKKSSAEKAQRTKVGLSPGQREKMVEAKAARAAVAKRVGLDALGKPRSKMGKPLYRNCILKIIPEGSVEPAHELSMEYIGKQHYRAEVKMSAGNFNFIAGKKRGDLNVPSSEENASYVFVLDARKHYRQRITIYNKDLAVSAR